MNQPAPLSALPAEVCKGLTALLTDIDDTLTTEGKLTAVAYRALWDARDAGLDVVAVTGRPAGWADHIARMWPVTGVVAENGAMYLRHSGGRMIRQTILASDSEVSSHQERLQAVARDILREVPGTALASDQAYREFDLAIDYCEDVDPLPATDVQKILDVFLRHGATAKVSSIHVNGWFGDYDKLGMLRRFASEQLGADVQQPEVRQRFVYAGDSPNDEPMFEFFPNSVGVANIDDFEASWKQWPRYRTPSRAGAGFAELLAHILAHR